MKIHNYMEDVVDLVLDKIILEDGYKDECSCEQCINDIKAIALNDLKPRYVATQKGVVMSKASMLSIQYEVDVTTKLMSAIDRVSKSPRHGDSDNEK